MKTRLAIFLTVSVVVLLLAGCNSGKVSLAKLAGEYDLMGSPLSFQVQDGKLFIDIPGQGPGELIREEENPQRFSVAGIPDSTVEFVLKDGKVTEVLFRFAGQELRAVRK